MITLSMRYATNAEPVKNDVAKEGSKVTRPEIVRFLETQITLDAK